MRTDGQTERDDETDSHFTQFAKGSKSRLRTHEQFIGGSL